MKNILFVCLGNICRSPSAEAVFRKKASALSLDLIFDSAGTSGNHVGERSDQRSIKHAEQRGYEMTHLARQIAPADFERFDLILVMDQNNFKSVEKICPAKFHGKIKMLADYCKTEAYVEVPDPYYGAANDFETVIDIIEEAWEGFLRTHFSGK